MAQGRCSQASAGFERFHIRLVNSLVIELDVLTVVADGDPQQHSQIGRPRDELDRAIAHRNQYTAGMRRLQRVVVAGSGTASVPGIFTTSG